MNWTCDLPETMSAFENFLYRLEQPMNDLGNAWRLRRHVLLTYANTPALIFVCRPPTGDPERQWLYRGGGGWAWSFGDRAVRAFLHDVILDLEVEAAILDAARARSLPAPMLERFEELLGVATAADVEAAVAHYRASGNSDRIDGAIREAEVVLAGSLPADYVG